MYKGFLLLSELIINYFSLFLLCSWSVFIWSAISRLCNVIQQKDWVCLIQLVVRLRFAELFIAIRSRGSTVCEVVSLRRNNRLSEYGLTESQSFFVYAASQNNTRGWSSSHAPAWLGGGLSMSSTCVLIWIKDYAILMGQDEVLYYNQLLSWYERNLELWAWESLWWLY